MSEQLEPGLKVVCIDNSLKHPGQRDPGCNYPEIGVVYTIRDVITNPYNGIPLILLREIVNPPTRNGKEGAFDASRFRPIRNRSTDITIFKEIDESVFGKTKVRA